MNILIIKLGATGDVVRTTPLVRLLRGDITWIAAPNNTALLEGLAGNVRCVSWTERESVRDIDFDLVINLEDEKEQAAFVNGLRYKQLFGTYLDSCGALRYTEDSRRWFDLSLISVHGKEKADRLKFLNRQTYQELIFDGLRFRFEGHNYLLPEGVQTDLSGDVAIAPVAGAVWPMKTWAYYDRLKADLVATGLKVNVLPHRQSLLEHLGDVQNHRCLVSGDSLPMHLALGTGTACVTLFNCTSPWEIHDYGVQTKIVSPLLEEFFYKRGFDPRGTAAISLAEVFGAVMNRLNGVAKHGDGEPRCESRAG